MTNSAQYKADPATSLAGSLFSLGSRLRKVVRRLVVVERQALGAAKLGQDGHDVGLLAGRQLVFAVMIAVVRTATVAEVVADLLACQGTQIAGHVLIQTVEAPGHSHLHLFTEAAARSAGPGRRQDCRAHEPVSRLLPIGLIVQAAVVLLTVAVETDGISKGDIFQFLLIFHNT